MVLYVYAVTFFRPNNSGALISSLSDWNNIRHLLQKCVGDVHTSLHSAAADHAETFISVANGQQSDILSMASSVHWQEKERNMCAD